MIDLNKAEALLRAEGFEVVLPGVGSAVAAYLPNGDSVPAARTRSALGVVDGTGRPAADMEALAARLLAMAALCRRIEAECQEEV